MTSDDTSTDNVEASQPAAPGRRIRKNDRALIRIPVIDWSITINEVHASLIGVATGAIGGLAWVAGKAELTILLVFVFGGYALIGRPVGASMSESDPEYCSGNSNVSIAVRTIRHEPWYFLTFMTSILCVLILA